MKRTLLIVILLAGISNTYCQKTNKMDNIIQIQSATLVEYVTFTAKEGVTQQEMLIASKSTDTVLKAIKGFKHRFISLQENNTWVEIVFWESKKDAVKGLNVFLEHSKSKFFLSKIKEGSVKIEYSEIL